MINFHTIIFFKIFQFIIDGFTLYFNVHLSNKSRKTFSKLYLCNILISIISFFVFYNDIKTNIIFTVYCFSFSYTILFIKTAKANNGIY